MKALFPLVVSHEAGVSPHWIDLVVESIHTALRFAGVTVPVDLRRVGDWKAVNYRNAHGLVPYKSMEWFIQEGQRNANGPGMLQTDRVVQALMDDPWQQVHYRYRILVVNQGLHMSDNTRLLGVSTPGTGCILSTLPFRLGSRWREGTRECFRTLALHELGHLFGVVPPQRTTAVEHNIGRHCTNASCVMRQFRSLDHFDLVTSERIRALAPYCAMCRQDMRYNFGLITDYPVIFRPRRRPRSGPGTSWLL